MKTVCISETDNLNEVLNSFLDEDLEAVFPHGAVFRQKVCITRGSLTVRGNGSAIVWDDHNGMAPGFGTSASATLTVRGSDNLFDNLIVENDFDYPRFSALQGEDLMVRRGLQAVAVFTDPNSTDTRFENCTFRSWQDTLFCDGAEDRYFNCTISGNIDFIFGRSHAVFRNCRIISLGEGFVTAPSTMADREHGLVFENCTLECTPDVRKHCVYLARPWHPQAKEGVCPSVRFESCFIGPHIHPQLWTTMHDSTGGIHTPEQSRFSFVNCMKQNR
ncbi:MAG: hypothetical protein IJM73_06455 [Spirochaetales bacterium]|nr:hypothetical protein [Spirochaetales bacterium]